MPFKVPTLSADRRVEFHPTLLNVHIPRAQETTFYAVAFDPFFDEAVGSRFAAVAGRAVVIVTMKGEIVDKIETYEDVNEDESLYTCSWVLDTHSGFSNLAIGGKLGIIKVIDIDFNVSKTLLGHGSEIFDIKTHPTTPILIASASNDYSIRLWNHMCPDAPLVSIFGGENGHRAPVLAIDFHPCLPTFISSGMDRTINIWALPKDIDYIPYGYEDLNPKAAHSLLERLDEITRNQLNRKPTVHHYPIFSSDQIHSNYVDSVAWLTGSVNELSEIPSLAPYMTCLTSSHRKQKQKTRRSTSTMDNSDQEIPQKKTSGNGLIRANDLILSKSALEGCVKVWHIILEQESPDKSGGFYDLGVTSTSSNSTDVPSRLSPYSAEILAQIPLPDCELWYIRFGLYDYGSLLALGNSKGKTYIWDLLDLSKKPDSNNNREPNIFKLETPVVILDWPPLAGAGKDTPTVAGVTKSDLPLLHEGQTVRSNDPTPIKNMVVRHLGWSMDGNTLVAVGERGVICIWNLRDRFDT